MVPVVLIIGGIILLSILGGNNPPVATSDYISTLAAATGQTIIPSQVLPPEDNVPVKIPEQVLSAVDTPISGYSPPMQIAEQVQPVTINEPVSISSARPVMNQ